MERVGQIKINELISNRGPYELGTGKTIVDGIMKGSSKQKAKYRYSSAIALAAAFFCTQMQAAAPGAQASKALLELSSPKAPWQTVIVKSGDSLEKIFKEVGLDLRQLQEVLSVNRATSKALSHIKPGQTMKVQTTPSGHKLLQLKYALDNDRMLWVQRASAGFKTVVAKSAREEAAQPKNNGSNLRFVSGTIHHSFAETAKSVGMSHTMTNQLGNIFDGRVNFKHLQVGDNFSFIYQPNSKDLNNGNILAAEFSHHNSDYQAVRYTDRLGHTGYFDPKGKNFSSTASFLRYPVQFKRISSPFSYRRMDPVLHRVHQHLGVDLAAPRGTPIKSIGDGKVEFMGRKGGYGNTVVVSYGPNYKALFGHLSRFSSALRRNSSVHQGQVIGYVGSTGWATGSHVHYELHVNGVARDPLKISLPTIRGLESRERLHFLQQSKVLLAQLELFQRPELAANNAGSHKGF